MAGPLRRVPQPLDEVDLTLLTLPALEVTSEKAPSSSSSIDGIGTNAGCGSAPVSSSRDVNFLAQIRDVRKTETAAMARIAYDWKRAADIPLAAGEADGGEAGGSNGGGLEGGAKSMMDSLIDLTGMWRNSEAALALWRSCSSVSRNFSACDWSFAPTRALITNLDGREEQAPKIDRRPRRPAAQRRQGR